MILETIPLNIPDILEELLKMFRVWSDKIYKERRLLQDFLVNIIITSRGQKTEEALDVLGKNLLKYSWRIRRVIYMLQEWSDTI